jgi:competence protein ComEA
MNTIRTFRRAVLAAALLPVLAFAGPVNINSADARTLAKELQGVGLTLAQAIVEYREKNGAFKRPEDLAQVRGIGMKVVERNRENIQVGSAGPGRGAARAAPKPAD